MARHSAGFHPLSYSVWYEYAAGSNPELRAAVDARLAQACVLSDRDIEVLFDAHVAMRDIDSSARMRAEIARMIDHVNGVAVEAGQEVQQYGNELEGYRERLRDDIGKDSLNQMVESLIGETEEELRGGRATAWRARAGAGPGAGRPNDRAIEPARL